MVDKGQIYKNIVQALTDAGAEFKVFEHRAALTYEDLAAVQQEAGFVGAEGKCLVVKSDNGFAVYVTLQGKKVDLAGLAAALGVKKVRLASAEELAEQFGAEPGCAYPFGFDSVVPIFVDPAIYGVEWFLFSPLYATKTVQVRGGNLPRVFSGLPNKIVEQDFTL
jgi:Ala-tRNA(Pro) deacylase